MDKPDLEQTLAYYEVDTSRLKHRGWTKILCPVHAERDPSCGVNLEAQKIHCMACDFKGDSLDLIQRMQNFKTVGEALAYARDHLGLQGSAVRDNDRQAKPERYRFRWEAEGY